MMTASLAVITVSAVSSARGWTTTLNPVVTLTAPAIGLLTGALAGITSAFRAALTPPATILRA